MSLASPPPPLRVAIVAPSLRIRGGQAVQADRLLRAWRDDPDVDAWLVPVNPLPPRLLRPALRIKYARTIATELTYFPLLVRELARADLVHVFSASYSSFLLAPLPAIAVALALKRPVLLNYRSGQAPDHLSRSAIARATLARVNRNVVPSAFLVDVFKPYGIDATVIPNIVDLERFKYRPRERVAPRLVSTRNFEDLYNVACTLRAFAMVQARWPDAALTLVGGGSYEASLRRMASDLGLANVTFVGRVEPDEIAAHYAANDVYVQTPDIDNMPASILEAFASGLPVVSTDAGGVSRIVTDQHNGLLAPVDDHHAVAACILRLLDEPRLASELARRAYDACGAYTWPVVRRRWLDVYQSTVDAARSARKEVGATRRDSPAANESRAV